MYTVHNTYAYQDGFKTIKDAIDSLVVTAPKQDHFITNSLGNTTVAIYHQGTVFLPRAAAPELLAACEAARRHLSRSPECDGGHESVESMERRCDVLDMLDAAIAAANGSSS